MIRSFKMLLLTIGTIALVQSATAQKSEDYIITIKQDGEVIDRVTLFEFENIYKKNNPKTEVDRQSLEEYLDLFVNFKLKVKEAEALGMDTVQAFIRELAGYRRQLAKPYLIDSEVNKSLIEEAYERTKLDVKASHILIKVEENASPADTLKAWNKINSLRKQAERGSDFAKLAEAHSEDPSAAENGGNLGYFTVFQMVYPFETAAYNTKPGEISPVVRTRFGYHIIKVDKKRTSKGKVKVAHIMVQVPNKASEEDEQKLKTKAEEIYKKLQDGEDYVELARNYSDDKGSSTRGGALPTFGTGRMVEEFEEAAFAIENVGDYTRPVRTPYGWHIIKLLETQPHGSFEEMENELKNRVARDGRATVSRSALISSLRKEYDISVNQKAVDAIAKTVDDTWFEGRWDAKKAANLKSELFTISDNKYGNAKVAYDQQDFVNFLNSAQKRKENKAKQKVKPMVEALLDEYVGMELVRFEEDNLEAKYPKFKALMQEYRDGILLFELMDQKVWSKAVQDTAGLRAFYHDHKNNFMWEQRVQASIYTCANDDVASKTRKLVKKQRKKGLEDVWVLDQVNIESQLDLKIETGKWLKGDNETVDATNWEPGFSDNTTSDDRVVFVYVDKVLDPEPKSLKEAKGLVTADYQTYLEEKWIEELQGKYEVTRHLEMLDKIK